jgi:import inner membrane translocase subunit TIM23
MFVGGGCAGALFLSTGLAEPVTSQIPLDPVITLGLMTFAFAALGWLVGPSLGSAVFYLAKRQWKTQMKIKEAQFFARIKKHRVDPSASSMGNPGKFPLAVHQFSRPTNIVTVPDFYGEKISSVAGYRQWLKDQRAFNKKRTTFI